MTTERDLRNQMAYAKQEAIAEGLAIGHAKGHAIGHAEGHAEGHAKGHAEGHAEARTEVARNLKAAGIDHTIISSATGLTLEDIMQL